MVLMVLKQQQKVFWQKSKYLTIDQAALLVGLLPAPASCSPIHHPDRAEKRRSQD